MTTADFIPHRDPRPGLNDVTVMQELRAQYNR